MYETFFDLKHKPFSLLPDPDFLYLSSRHALALSLLEYCLSGQAGFCVITGEIGSGKTTLVRAFLGRVGREFTVGIMANTHHALHDVSAWALNAFGKKATGATPAETYQDLMSYLIAEYSEGRQCILIVDEAQNLSIEAMEELRLLSNINSGKDLLLQIVLVGQPELLSNLKRPELTQFAQRIAVSHHLSPLPYADTRQYIRHRLKVAGTERPIFTEMAMGAVQYFSGGVPRLVNSICDLALVYAFADGQPVVDEDFVFRVVADRQSSGIAPFARSEAATDPEVRAEISQLAETASLKDGVSDQPPAENRVQQPPSPPAPASSPLSSESNEREQAIIRDSSAVQPERNDFYFRDSQSDGDLLLVAEANEATAGGTGHRQQMGQPSDRNSPHGFVPQNDTIVNSERVVENPGRPSWQAPARSVSSQSWPSIKEHGAGEHPVGSAANAAGRRGTGKPLQRSWWRRGLLSRS